MKIKIRLLALTIVCFAMLTQSACMSAYVKSVGGDNERVFDRIFRTDFDTTWQSVLEALKSSPIEISNRETGFIRTKWIENTDQKSFIESYGPGKAFLKSQYRLRVTVTKGTFERIPSVKVSILKEQLIQHDALEGWKSVPTDELDEMTFLYRTERIITIRTAIAKQEQKKADEEAKKVEF